MLSIEKDEDLRNEEIIKEKLEKLGYLK